MSYEIRLPNITAPTVEGQLSETHAYLRQLAEYLQWAFNSVSGETSGNNVLGVEINGGATIKEKQSQEVFNSIKDLIIKSADIVEAYEHAMKIKLDGGAMAVSSLGKYLEQRETVIKANSSGISMLNTRTQGIQHSDITGKEYTEVFQEKAYMRAGFLEEKPSDSSNVYGIEIGEYVTENGVEKRKKMARFTGSRLSFYDNNDVEVAYISDRVLHIRQAEIEGHLRVGRYIMQTDRGGLAFLWTGGSSGNS